MWPVGFCWVSPSCCCFVVVIYLQKQSDEMSEGRALPRVPGAASEIFLFIYLAQRWRPAEQRSSQGTEGERGWAICGTDMVDVSQLVGFCLKWCQKVMALRCSSRPDPCVVTLFGVAQVEVKYIYSCKVVFLSTFWRIKKN